MKKTLLKMIGILIIWGVIPIWSQSLQQARPWMGVAIEDKPEGVYVKDAISGTPAERAGIRKGDLIKKIDSTDIGSSQQLISYILSKGVGNEVIVYFERDQKPKQLTLQLEAKPDDLELIRKKIIGVKLPEFQLLKLKNKAAYTNNQIQGKVTVIEFWATWCPACVSSHGRLSEFASENPNTRVLAVTDEEEGLVKEYVNRVKPKFTTLRDPSHEFMKFFSVTAIPMTVVVDQKGVVRFATLGSGSYLEEALNFAKKLELNDKKK
jgi:cytochrome c biogenesis protein CcmG/thiol:disulfide interchange protein DsbE